MGAPGKAILSQEIGLGAPRVRSGRPNLRPKPAVNRDEGAQVAGTIPNLRPKPAENRDEGAQVAGTIPNLRPKPAENRDEGAPVAGTIQNLRSEDHTSELQSLMRISYDDLCLKQNQHTIHSLHCNRQSHESTSIN